MLSTGERKKLCCIVCLAFCQGFCQGCLQCVFEWVVCLISLPCYVLYMCFAGLSCDSGDGDSTPIIYSNGSDDSDSDDSDSDDSSQWFTARSFKRQPTGAGKNKLEELKPLVF